jgi:hypothetical protein
LAKFIWQKSVILLPTNKTDYKMLMFFGKVGYEKHTKMHIILQHNFAPYLPGLLDWCYIIELISFVWCHQRWQKIDGGVIEVCKCGNSCCDCCDNLSQCK